MHAWSGNGGGDSIMGPTVTRAESIKTTTPPLKNGNDLRESGYLIAVGSKTARFRRKHKSKLLSVALLTLIVFLLLLAIAMTVLYVKQRKNKPIRICESKECLRSAANLAVSMDKTADPCENFYQYVCGNWAVDHPRPDVYRSYDWFRDKQTKVYTLVRDFLSRNMTDQPKPIQQAKDMYSACMDIETMNKRGLKPVLTVLESLGLPSFPTYLNATEDFDYNTYTFDWLDAVIKIKTLLGMDVLIGFDIFLDPKNSSVYRLVMGSPETTNPFPSLYNDKKKHAGRKTVAKFRIPTKEQSADDKFPFNDEYYFTGKENDEEGSDEEQSKNERLYRIYYAEIIKLMFLESEGLKLTKLPEEELDRNILQASNEYVTLYNALYEIESGNDTETDELSNVNIPDYTVDEIQAHTDMIVEANNSTATLIWKRYLDGVFSGSDVQLDYENDKILISEMDLRYMSLMASLIAQSPPVAIELYVWLQVVEVMAIHTTSELRNLHQRYYEEIRGKTGSGVPARSLQCASAVNDMLGMAIAYAIADRRFLNDTKPKVQIMLNEMKNALSRLIGRTKWMDDQTKLATYEKIEQMRSEIGFPDWLLEDGKLDEYYSGIEINVETHLENMINIVQARRNKALQKFRKPTNVSWSMDPTEVNAYHSFQENTITIPLVMLQYPFYDLGLDSLNYGSLGSVLGHEITHGFDDFGRRFDKNGNLLPWWTNDTISSYENMTQCFVEQYSTYYIEELDQYVNGKKTLDENIADNGGLREALSALHEHLHKYGPELKLPGFEHMSSEQMFFLSYGNLWCEVSTRDSLKSDLEDVHSPLSLRARGALQNNVEFAKAFKCPSGSSMNPTTRCIIF